MWFSLKTMGKLSFLMCFSSSLSNKEKAKLDLLENTFTVGTFLSKNHLLYINCP